MTGAERVLERLRQGPASHLELYRLGVIAHSRVAELRKKGHVITCERDGDLYVYVLGAEPAPQSGAVNGGEASRIAESAPTPDNWTWLLREARNPDHGRTSVAATGEGTKHRHTPGLSEQPSPPSLDAPPMMVAPARLLNPGPASPLPLTSGDAGQLTMGEPAARPVVEGVTPGGQHETQGDAADG